MITTSQYQEIVGAEAPENFASLQSLVIARLEAALGRGLRSAQYTERCSFYRDGYLYPKTTPVTDVEGYAFDDISIHIGQQSGPGAITITYTGGFADFGDEGDAPCPTDLASAIAFGVHTLSNPTPGQIAPGLQSLSIAGEWSMTKEAGVVIGADGQLVPSSLVEIADLGGRCATLAARYRRIS